MTDAIEGAICGTLAYCALWLWWQATGYLAKRQLEPRKDER